MQIETWASEYMSQWPELLNKQIEDYAAQELDWRLIAEEKVFPHLGARLSTMQEAHGNILRVCDPIYLAAQHTLDFKSQMVFVIYVGIGCGAGWATLFLDLPAILLGLENIAECGWSDAEAVTGLVVHEIGHLVHTYWRREDGKQIGSGPWWQLYAEGFAQRCESTILNTQSWHQASESDDDWLKWCQSHKGWLANEFLRRVDIGVSVSPFFGSWLDISGKRETGYFLGHELIRELQEKLSLKEIAAIDDIESYLRPLLEKLAKLGG